MLRRGSKLGSGGVLQSHFISAIPPAKVVYYVFSSFALDKSLRRVWWDGDIVVGELAGSSGMGFGLGWLLCSSS